ncbi:DNA recombination protein RmuC [Lutimonas zeaxanthinifaciens]|uniref:DNA recombination protein RmuC n=1 Tax=Lutimonas zeaxanthinifaciens TaxID=3060215 RepID=UPI00265D5895|nr:DNA recombination protein RmuC [Lutimonas sp. YSD2104]WKK67377.1 DNA recombination protein RmuC [Lutimonas sp. YSD2104]
MSDFMLYIILGIVLVLAVVITYVISKLKFEKTTAALESKMTLMDKEKSEKETEINELQQQLEISRRENQQVQMELVKKNAALENAGEKLEAQQEDIAKLQEKFSKDFEILANKILEEKSNKFTQRNKENMEQILNPLQEKIKTFEKKVEDTHKESIEKQSALRQQILGLKELNEQMSKDAVNLTRALKGDSKKQGDWGEFQLETILEKAGLQKDVHFSTQDGYRDEDSRLKKPDLIINLPDNKHLIIDSKVSLTGYERFFNAENEIAEKTSLKSHVQSIQKHIKELGSKNYTDLYGINSPDYVIMYVPIEPALMIALQEDQELYIQALDKNVVMVSTSTLLATLTTVASIWKQEDQKRNVMEIARQAGALYDKFEGLVQDLIKVGKQINASQEGYKAAMNKLSEGKGNLITRVENLKKLGAKTKKALPPSLLERAEEN